MKRPGSLAIALLVLAAPILGAAELKHSVINLWPDGSPNNPAKGPRPNMEIFYPISEKYSIPAVVVICPGGGYGSLSPYERFFAEYFRTLGYTAVVVNYRVAPTLCRDASDDLANNVSDRLILAYPVISVVLGQTGKSKTFSRLLGDSPPESLKAALSPERHVTEKNPPPFIFHAADDDLISPENSILFARACWAAGVPAELHIFPRGGHGRNFAHAPDASPPLARSPARLARRVGAKIIDRPTLVFRREAVMYASETPHHSDAALRARTFSRRTSRKSDAPRLW